MKSWAIATITVLSTAALCAQSVFSGSADLDAAIDAAVREGTVPGAVLLVGHNGSVVYQKAYGSRALEPAREAMTLDTIFDLASLTKVIATTPSIMKLVEQGKVRLNDPVTAYLKDFQGGKSDITVRDLLTHFSGLRPDLDLQPAWLGYETGIRKALNDKPQNPAGVRFMYSDINFELLGEIVNRVSGKPLDQFAQDEIFKPLGMSETSFHPAASLRPRIAPTEFDASVNAPLRGIVHDPTARYMGGVAGHAGVFSTAADLAKYAQMMLDEGGRLFSPLTIRKFTSANSPPDQHIVRGLGWDIDSGYSAPRGDLFPIGSYGHTGFTGTSLWIDPASKTYVILLANSVHPRGNKNLSPLRSKIASIVAASVGVSPAKANTNASYETLGNAGTRRMVAANHDARTGLDVLQDEHFAALEGKRVGLITNHTGLTREGKRNIDAMREAGINLTALFSPEHGLTGTEDKPDIADSKDPASGLTIWSLYQNSRFRMPLQGLSTVDTLVFDIQDAGVRFYTYSCTLLSAMEEAAKAKVPFYVLDRPNPLTGFHAEGPELDDELRSFVGCYNMPVRHGLTLGELATMANAERKIGADLHIVKMKNWQRDDWFDSTGLTWVDPSPNLRSLNAALLYPGLALLEASPGYSVGRGTDAPFEQVGAPWIHGAELARFLNNWVLPGVRVYPVRFRPSSGPAANQMIEGVRFVIVNREQFNSVRLGLDLAYSLERLYPGKISLEACRFLIGNRTVINGLKTGKSPGILEQEWQEMLQSFEQRRRPYLLY